MSFCERERRGLLVDLRGALPLEPDSRAVYSQRAIANHFYAIAMVINVDLISRIMANVYMQVARLPIRMKVFADFQAALDWLKAIEPKDR